MAGNLASYAGLDAPSKLVTVGRVGAADDQARLVSRGQLRTALAQVSSDAARDR